MGHFLEDAFLYLLMAGALLLPVILMAVDFILFLLKKESLLFEAIAFFIGSVYMILAYWLWDLPVYSEPLNIYGFSNVHEPFHRDHLFTLTALAMFGFLSYLFLKFKRKTLAPLVEVLCLAGVYIGCGISIAFCIQLLCGGHPTGLRMGPDDWLFILCLCVVPVLYLCHVIWLIRCLVAEKAGKQAGIRYANPVLQKFNIWLLKGANLFWVTGLVMLPLLGILIMILCLFGQQPDSIVKAFTETSDWILSGQISPPPVEYDAHYLCTVSLRGHKKLVKPLRYGLRKGNRIVVNRQLCVANAFEQLIMERTPRFHHAVRSFYDKYGYPISKHIRTAWTADVVYLLMKPLEWFFLLTLYLFDKKPEDRIARQYLPKIPTGTPQ